MADRKASFKAPPTLERNASQNARRERALEEQRKKREQRIDAARNLDLFAGLTLGASDEEDADGVGNDGTADIVREGVGGFTALIRNDASSSSTQSTATPGKGSKWKKGKGKGKQKRANAKYSDVCMYAELFNMREPDAWSADATDDGLPEDLDAWVALAPVPVGKRCLAVTNQSSGVAGSVPNTILRSRVLGKRLLQPFPSPLPPSTVLDCILDPNWHENGIIHVLDVIRWKGQDIGDGEASFRFWWRDTRLSELFPLPFPTSAAMPRHPVEPEVPAAGEPRGEPSYAPMDLPIPQGPYKFPHPHTFLPIPYYTDTTLPSFLSTLIPLARTSRMIAVDVPFTTSKSVDELSPARSPDQMDMDMGMDMSANGYPALVQRPTTVQADGLLLYVAEASYEPGTSPLSAWVPIVSYEAPAGTSPLSGAGAGSEGPLAMFERLISRRLHLLSAQASGSRASVDAMEV